jgi:hypothetical protein
LEGYLLFSRKNVSFESVIALLCGLLFLIFGQTFAYGGACVWIGATGTRLQVLDIVSLIQSARDVGTILQVFGLLVVMYIVATRTLTVDKRFRTKLRFSLVTILSIMLAFASSVVLIPVGRANLIATTTYYLDTPLPIADYYAGQYQNNTFFAINGTNWDMYYTSADSNVLLNNVLGNASSGVVYVGTGAYSATVTVYNGTRLIIARGATGITASIDTGATATIEDQNAGFTRQYVSGSLISVINLSTGLVDMTYGNFTQYWWGGENRTDTLAYPEQTASYIVFQDGSLTKMKNCTTGHLDFQSTNASAVIQYALDNGNFTFLKAGEYVVDGLTFTYPINDGHTLKGEGRFNTILKLRDGANNDVINAYDVNKITISDLFIDGNNAENTVGNGIVFDAPNYVQSYSTLERLAIWETPEDAIAIGGYVLGVHMNDIEINAPNGTGIGLAGQDATLNSIFIGSCGLSGISIYGSHNQLVNIHVWGCGTLEEGDYDGIVIYGESNEFTNIESENNYRNGMIIFGCNNTFVNGQFWDNSVAGAYTGHSICIYDGSGNTLMAFVLKDYRESPLQNCGISEGGDADYNTFIGCDTRSNWLNFGMEIIGANSHVIASWNATSWVSNYP